MALYIMQHGKNLQRESDPEQGLSPKGIEEVKRIAMVAKSYHVVISEIWHSGKKRARQTADIVQEIMEPPKGVMVVGGMDPLDDVREFSGRLNFKQNILLVGHLPFLEKLLSYLITGDPNYTLFQMQNGGMMCLECYRSSQKISVHWSLMPLVG